MGDFIPLVECFLRQSRSTNRHKEEGSQMAALLLIYSIVDESPTEPDAQENTTKQMGRIG